MENQDVGLKLITKLLIKTKVVFMRRLKLNSREVFHLKDRKFLRGDTGRCKLYIYISQQTDCARMIMRYHVI